MEFKLRWIFIAVAAASAVPVLAALTALAPTRAQLLLPGAAFQAQPPEAAPAPNPAPAPPKKPKPAPTKAPPITSILGHELSRNGSEGAISFRAAPNKGIEITKLSLAGEETTDTPGPCLVDVVTEEPIRAKFAGRPNGLARYDVDIKACPFSFEILNGAILIGRSPPACEFTAAQCRVKLAGLWGPPGKSLGPDQAKRFERERGRAETEMRNEFRALMAKAGKDKEAVKKIAGEQAGFSSARETACRSYAGEDTHGYCALRLTQARIAALQAELSGSGASRAKQEKNATAKRKPARDSMPAPAPNTEAPPAPPAGDTPR